MTSPTPEILWEDDKYAIRNPVSTEEYRDQWWSWIQTLHWNRSYYDLESYMEPTHGTKEFILVDKASSLPVGFVAAVVNANSTGWVATFILDESHRGKGLGGKLFQIMLEEFQRQKVQIIGLDAVVEQQKTYERRGFQVSPLGQIRVMNRPLVAKKPLAHAGFADARVVDIRDVPVSLLASHEEKYTGFSRENFWVNMFSRPDVLGYAVVSTPHGPQHVDEILAWTTIRRCDYGMRMAPLYAQDPICAEAVMVAAINAATPAAIRQTPLPNDNKHELDDAALLEKTFLDAEVWTGNADAVTLFEKLGWEGIGVEYERMWLNGKATAAQSAGGASAKGVFATFDAAVA